MAAKVSVKQRKRAGGPGKYDHLRPEEAVRTAWAEEGPQDRELRRVFKNQVAAAVEARMPLLWRAIQRLIEAEYPTVGKALVGRLEQLAAARPTGVSEDQARGYREGVRAALGVVLEETKMAAMGKGEEAAEQYLAEGRLS